MASVRQLCKSGVILENGRVAYTGTAEDCVEHYIGGNMGDLNNYATDLNQYRHIGDTMREFEYLDIRMLNDVTAVSTEEPLRFEMTVRRNKTSITQAQFGFVIRNASDLPVGSCYSKPVNVPVGSDVFKVKLELPNHHLAKGKYSLNFNIVKFDYSADMIDYDIVRDSIRFQVEYLDAAHQTNFTFWQGLGSSAYQNVSVNLIK